MPGTPAPVKPYGNRPGTTIGKSPVPTQNTAEELFADLEDMSPTPATTSAPASAAPVVPTAPTVAPSAPTLSADDLFADIEAPAPSSGASGTFGQMGMNNGEFDVSEDTFSKANVTGAGIKEQLGEAFTRLKTSFAGSKKEERQVLEDKFGKGNVKLVDDAFFVKRKGDKKFTKFDRDTFEIIGDILDFGRPAVEEGIIAPFEAAGAVMGNVPGFLTGRVAGAAAATNVADMIGEKLLGIERDPERSRARDTAIAVGINGSLGVAGGVIRRVAKNAKFGAQSAIPERELLSRASQEFMEISDQLKQSGLIQNIPGTDTPYMLHQLHPDSPAARDLARKVRELGTFREAQKLQGEIFEDTLKNYSGTVRQLVDGSPAPGGRIPEKFIDLSDSLRQAEASEIGKFKMMARAKIPAKTKLPVGGNVANDLASLMTEAGFKFQMMGNQLKIAKPDVDSVLGTLNLKTPGAARDFIEVFHKVAKKMDTKGLTLDEFDEVVNLLDQRYDTIAKSNSKFAAGYARVSSGIRDARRKAIQSGLGPEEAELFAKSMDRFGEIRGNQSTLAGILENDQVSTQAFVKQLFGKGKAGLPNVKAAKSLLRDHPQAWSNMAGQWLDDMVVKHGNNVDALIKDINGYGPEFLDTVFEGTGGDPKTLTNLLKFGSRIMSTREEAVTQTPGFQGWFRAAAQAFSEFTSAKMNFVAQVFGLTGNRADEMAKLMTSDGIEKFLDKVPAKKRRALMETFEKAVRYSEMNGFTKKATKYTPKGIRGEFRTEMIKRDNEMADYLNLDEANAQEE